MIISRLNRKVRLTGASLRAYSLVVILMPFTVIKASKLPQGHRVKAPNCYAAISVDGGPVQQTECKTGINPEWGDSPSDLYVFGLSRNDPDSVP
jgi:hypothetical protein